VENGKRCWRERGRGGEGEGERGGERERGREGLGRSHPQKYQKKIMSVGCSGL
jgi:hypothetical protein